MNKPKNGQDYWFIDRGPGLCVHRTVAREDRFDEKMLTDNNCFRTKALAQEALKRVKAALKESDGGWE
jgi:hypothetical protein